ncbi:MAG: hypothetical protein FWG85_01040 [Bacteroidetes bacterium]|nr:hypothetical protein [Bacteroidota bacterium]
MNCFLLKNNNNVLSNISDVLLKRLPVFDYISGAYILMLHYGEEQTSVTIIVE